MKRLRLAWQVLRHGLPVVEVTHTVVDPHTLVTVRYQGRTRGYIKDQELLAVDGEFTVALPLEEV